MRFSVATNKHARIACLATEGRVALRVALRCIALHCVTLYCVTLRVAFEREIAKQRMPTEYSRRTDDDDDVDDGEPNYICMGLSRLHGAAVSRG